MGPLRALHRRGFCPELGSEVTCGRAPGVGVGAVSSTWLGSPTPWGVPPPLGHRRAAAGWGEPFLETRPEAPWGWGSGSQLDRIKPSLRLENSVVRAVHSFLQWLGSWAVPAWPAPPCARREGAGWHPLPFVLPLLQPEWLISMCPTRLQTAPHPGCPQHPRCGFLAHESPCLVPLPSPDSLAGPPQGAPL